MEGQYETTKCRLTYIGEGVKGGKRCRSGTSSFLTRMMKGLIGPDLCQ